MPICPRSQNTQTGVVATTEGGASMPRTQTQRDLSLGPQQACRAGSVQEEVEAPGLILKRQSDQVIVTLLTSILP